MEILCNKADLGHGLWSSCNPFKTLSANSESKVRVLGTCDRCTSCKVAFLLPDMGLQEKRSVRCICSRFWQYLAVDGCGGNGVKMKYSAQFGSIWCESDRLADRPPACQFLKASSTCQLQHSSALNLQNKGSLNRVNSGCICQHLPTQWRITEVQNRVFAKRHKRIPWTASVCDSATCSETKHIRVQKKGDVCCIRAFFEMPQLHCWNQHLSTCDRCLDCNEYIYYTFTCPCACTNTVEQKIIHSWVK